MMTHECPTGYHDEPDYSCYSAHGCRCTRCRELKVARNRWDRWGGEIPDETEWMDRTGVIELISDLTERVRRLQEQVNRLETRPATVVRHKTVECDCDLPEPLPERLPAGPLVDLVESRRRSPRDQLGGDESLQSLFYRARKQGSLTFDAADRLALALGHTLETLYVDMQGAA